MNKLSLTLIALVLACGSAFAQATIDLIPYAAGFEEPVDIACAGDGRLFVAEKDGYIKIIEADGTVLDTPFLDIDDDVRSSGSEQGLLGLAFHPDYANNGYFYVNYTNNNGDTYIARYSVNPDNPNLANPNSRFIIYIANQPYNNHNGGDLNFGPDGYLYIALGDGGSSGDPGNRAQNLNINLGKILRIDVDNGGLYRIPEDNPYVGAANALGEIWASGLRNPWRFSFDKNTGDMWIADVGQDFWEEINFQPADSKGGENYGWRCFEGSMEYNTNSCTLNEVTYTIPVHEYINNSFSTGCSVTGGYVYRGEKFDALHGMYIYTDYCSGRFWYIKDNNGAWEKGELGKFSSYNFAAFGENKSGELYVAGLSDGIIYNIIDPNQLPIELLDFSVQNIDNQQVELKWTTASETNNAAFNIQRTHDGINFVNIGRMTGAGTTNLSTNYTYLDESPLSGTAYYRLQQMDTDGKFSYSKTLEITLDRSTFTTQIYPNPVRSAQSLVIDFGENIQENIVISIHDMNGKCATQIDFSAGINRLEIPIKNLSSGVYVLRGQFGTQHFIEKITVH